MSRNAIDYEEDFYAWTVEQARLLRGGDVSAIDVSNIAEEIESLGRSDRRELRSRLTVLLMHLLKWRQQRERRSTSWSGTIREQRRQIELVLDDSPSLRPFTKSAFPRLIAMRVRMPRRRPGSPRPNFPPNARFRSTKFWRAISCRSLSRSARCWRLPMERNAADYETDFYAWTIEQARLLRGGDLSVIDAANIAEEIESMGRSDRRELQSRLVVLTMHLLKWRHQPGVRSRSWSATIEEQRLQIENLFAESPSLRPLAGGMLGPAYSIARARAIAETGLADERSRRPARFCSTNCCRARICLNSERSHWTRMKPPLFAAARREPARSC